MRLLRPLLLSSNQCCRLQSTTISAATSQELLSQAKPYEAIPGPKPYPILGNALRYIPGIGEYTVDKWHEAQLDKYKKFGPIVREDKLRFGRRMVHLFDPEDMRTVYWNEGKYPIREFFESMKHVRTTNPDLYHSPGVAAGNGEEWYQMRSRVQTSMMRPKIVMSYLPQINVIAEDFSQRILRIRDGKGEVIDFRNELFKWALESVCYVMLNTRMGCLGEQLSPDSEPQLMIDCINDFFQSEAETELGLRVWEISPWLSPSYRKMKKVHIQLYKTSMKYIKKTMEEMARKGDDDVSNVSVMKTMLQKCSPQDASLMTVDAFNGGVDTTSFSMANLLYNLSRNPDVQRQLQKEVDTVLPNGAQLTQQALDKMPYLRACVKESARITPIVQGTSRTLPKDTVLSGYLVPANTVVTLNHNIASRDERHFPQPLEFRPERFLKDSDEFSGGNFAFQPFGFGPRMCIGRRIALMEIHALTAKLMQKFSVEYHYQEFNVVCRLVLMITTPLKFNFIDRKQGKI